MLRQIRALLQGKALDDVASYKVGERELMHVPWPDLLKLEAQYERRVRLERRRAMGMPQRFVPVIFGSAEEPSILRRAIAWLDRHAMWVAAVFSFLSAVFGIVAILQQAAGR